MSKYAYTGKPGNMRQSKPRKPRKYAPKRKYECKDGPLQGHSLFLSDGVTMIMNFGAIRGRYNNGEFTKC